MSSKKKIKEKKYFLFHPDLGEPIRATWEGDTVTLHYSSTVETEIKDTGSGYVVAETSPAWKEARITQIDYSLAADFAAALKIFNQNADKINGEYWTIFQGEKI